MIRFLFLGGTSTNVITLIGLGLAVCLSVWVIAALIDYGSKKLKKGKTVITQTVNELERILKDVTPMLQVVSETDCLSRPSPEKWSRKEILGHLIDSASNNHQRFVRAQLSAEIRLGGYEQERWVRSQEYQTESWADLVSLWNSYNRHLVHVIAAIPGEKLGNICFIGDSEPVTLEFLITDYLRHLKHHLEQILGGR